MNRAVSKQRNQFKNRDRNEKETKNGENMRLCSGRLCGIHYLLERLPSRLGFISRPVGCAAASVRLSADNKSSGGAFANRIRLVMRSTLPAHWHNYRLRNLHNLKIIILNRKLLL